METAKPSSNHSYKPSIIGQMIMLPSHGQSTAAVKRLRHRAGSTPYGRISRSGVFVIQARLILPSSFIKFYLD